MIFVIKHVANEGPGTIGEFFKRKGFVIREISLYGDDPLPTDLSDVEAVVCMGGPMNVYEEDKYHFLKDEDTFIRRVIKEEIPFLGICLGSQLLAKAAGAKVTKAPKEEIGWLKVSLTDEGKKDPLFQGLGSEFEVFQWHGDTFAIPKDGKHLVGAVDCRHQALKVGRAAYGLQFHIEVTEDMIKDWVRKHFKDAQGDLTQEGRNIISYYPGIKERFNKQANTVYNNFLKMSSAAHV